MRAKRGAPLSKVVKVVLAIALGVGRHAMAHAHGDHHDLSSGGSAGHGAAPAPAPPGYDPENGRGAGGGACAVLGGLAVYDLMAFCHEKGWRLASYGDGRYVVTTGTSAAAGPGVRGGDNIHRGEEGVSGRIAPPRGNVQRAHHRRRRRAATLPLFRTNSIDSRSSTFAHPCCPRCTD